LCWAADEELDVAVLPPADPPGGVQGQGLGHPAVAGRGPAIDRPGRGTNGGLRSAGGNYEPLAGDLVRRLCSPGDTAAHDLVGLTADLVFWRLWTRFDAMQEERRVSALAGVKGFAGFLANRLRVNLAGASPSGRVRAVRMTGFWGWRRRCGGHAAGGAGSGCTGPLSGRAVPGRLRPARAAATASRGLDDDDSRVQANAIETIEKAGWPDRVELIAPKLDSEDNRARGNAALVLVRAGDPRAARVLAEMLETHAPNTGSPRSGWSNSLAPRPGSTAWRRWARTIRPPRCGVWPKPRRRARRPRRAGEPHRGGGCVP